MYRENQKEYGLKLTFKNTLETSLFIDAENIANQMCQTIDLYINKINIEYAKDLNKSDHTNILELSESTLSLITKNLTCFSLLLKNIRNKQYDITEKNPIDFKLINKTNKTLSINTTLSEIIKTYITQYKISTNNNQTNPNKNFIDDDLVDQSVIYWQTLYNQYKKTKSIPQEVIKKFITAITKEVNKFLELLSSLKRLIDKIIIYEELKLENNSPKSHNSLILNNKKDVLSHKAKNYKDYLRLQLKKITNQPYYLLN